MQFRVEEASMKTARLARACSASFIAFPLLFVPWSPAGAIYKCVDKDGEVTFSDTKCDDNAKPAAKGDKVRPPQTEGPGVAAGSTDVEKYYPMVPHTVRWYAVKDVQSGTPVDLISFAIVAKEIGPGGKVVYLVENRFSGGVSVDYQEITSAQVQLDRLVLMRGATLTDVRYTPPLPLLRAPVEVGRSWSETQGDQPYTYRVESKFARRVLGTEYPDCVRVVRMRGGIVDYNTEYCPSVGVAAFEMLTGAAAWARAELVAIGGEADLIAVKSGARGCEYVFDPLVPIDPRLPGGGNLTLTVSPPGLQPMTFQRPADENIHVGLPAEAPRGLWRVEIKGSSERLGRSSLQTISWSGACRGDFLAPPPALGPSVTLVRQEAEPGRVTLTAMGAGWKADEPLTLTLAGPGWNTQTSPLGTANAAGVSPAVVVPFAHNLPRGDFTFTMRGTTQAATLTVKCQDAGFCAVKFWRQR